MHDRGRVGPDAEILSQPAAARLLARASELDAARVATATVAELRAAAAEAGISTSAFDTALAELRNADATRLRDVSAHRRWRARRWAVAAGVGAVIVASALVIIERAVPASAAAPMVEATILLPCLSAGEAAELVRRLLRLRANGFVYYSAHSQNVLTIRATPAQIEKVRSALEQYDRPWSLACVPRLAPTVTP